MKKKLYLDCCGRYIYNSQDDGDSIENIFRDNIQGNFASVNRNINIKCNSVKDLIRQQKIVDESLKLELGEQQKFSDLYKKPFSSSYSLSFQFKDFSTNSENHLLNTKPDDEHGYRLSKIGTLGTYENIQYTCWDGISNERLIKVLNGKKVTIDNQESLALSQIVSLFACESSRNPTSFLTAPMSLELAEEEFNTRKTKLEKEIEDLESKKQIKSVVTKLEKYINDLNELNSNKSEVVKEFILDYFPMAMKKAVAASRHISNKINDEFNIKEFMHQYDNGRASFNDAKEQDNKTLKIIEKWEYENSDFYEDINSLASKWYNIDTTSILGLYDWNQIDLE